jgi:hypothetical protein
MDLTASPSLPPATLVRIFAMIRGSSMRAMILRCRD